METVGMKLWLPANIWSLIDEKAKRTGKTRNDVVNDLVELSMHYSPEEQAAIQFDPDDPRWQSQYIEYLARKRLKVN